MRVKLSIKKDVIKITIRELYHWAKDNQALDLDIEVSLKKSFTPRYAVETDLYEEGTIRSAEIGTHVNYSGDTDSSVARYVKLLED